MKRFILIVTTTVLYNARLIHAQEYPSIENIMQEMQILKREIVYQKDKIHELTAMLDKQDTKEITNVFNKTVL